MSTEYFIECHMYNNLSYVEGLETQTSTRRTELLWLSLYSRRQTHTQK